MSLSLQQCVKVRNEVCRMSEECDLWLLQTTVPRRIMDERNGRRIGSGVLITGREELISRRLI